MHSYQRTPPWVFLIILALAALPPLLHLWIANAETPDRTPTGLSNADSAIYLQSMRMLGNGFYSPYASCQAPNGPNDPAFLPTPFHWFYALRGVVADAFHADHFLFLGVTSGLFGAIYLYVVFCFLRTAAPRQANLAFLLFTLGGGLGGMLYLATGALGLHDAPRFDIIFNRLAMYELLEGPYLSPVTHLSRIYYTLSLALCLGGLTALIKSMQIRCPRHLAFANLLFFAGTVINVRLGGFVLILAYLYLLTDTTSHPRDRLFARFLVSTAVGAAFALFAAMSLAAPTFMRNTAVLVREGMWPTAFVSAALLHLLLIPPVIRKRIPQLPIPLQYCSYAALGYLATYALLFAGYQIYYGNLLHGGDTAAAVALSDWAFLGAAAGVLLRAKRPSATTSPHETAWFVPWLLLFVVIAISAWGQGWFLRLTPQRLMALMGIPLSVLSATALQAWAHRRPRLAQNYTQVVVACGLASIVAGTLFFQGPLGRTPGQGPYAYLHRETMTPADAALLNELNAGIVLAPANFSDVIALREDMRVIGGTGGTDLSDLMSTEIDREIARFFVADLEMDRTKFLDTWCIDYVYCPDTWPVDRKTIQMLSTDPRLETLATINRGALFRVRP